VVEPYSALAQRVERLAGIEGDDQDALLGRFVQATDFRSARWLMTAFMRSLRSGGGRDAPSR